MHLSKLAGFRKSSSALTSGKTMQFIPRDGVYIYFRYDSRQTVMVIANTGEKNIRPDWTIYQERTAGFSNLRDVVSGKQQPLSEFEIRPGESFVFEMQK